MHIQRFEEKSIQKPRRENEEKKGRRTDDNLSQTQSPQTHSAEEGVMTRRLDYGVLFHESNPAGSSAFNAPQLPYVPYLTFREQTWGRAAEEAHSLCLAYITGRYIGALLFNSYIQRSGSLGPHFTPAKIVYGYRCCFRRITYVKLSYYVCSSLGCACVVHCELNSCIDGFQVQF
jgi:hypothetical protein